MCVGVVVELPASAVFREVEVGQVTLDEILKTAMLAHYESFAALNATASIFLVWWLICGICRIAALGAFSCVCVVGHVCWCLG